MFGLIIGSVLYHYIYIDACYKLNMLLQSSLPLYLGGGGEGSPIKLPYMNSHKSLIMNIL